MSFAAADSIGRTLARLGQLTTRAGAEQDTSREHILRLVQEAPEALSVEDIAGVTGLHENTVRTHLEVLRAGGRIERTRRNGGGRGRPKWMYAAVVADDPYYRLAQELTQALDAADGPEVAAEAAARWRVADDVAHDPVGSPDAAVVVAAQALERLGFDVDVTPTGDAVYLGQCPYAALVAKHPVICDIHAKALEQVLAGTGQDVTLESLDVFPRPGVCVAHLRRPDVVPKRVITGSADYATDSSEGPRGGTPKPPTKRRKR